MSRKIIIMGLSLLSAFNIATLIINLSSPSKGETSTGETPKAATSKGAPPKRVPSKGTEAKYQQLLRDPDFTRAVKEIIQECTVNVDLAKVEC